MGARRVVVTGVGLVTPLGLTEDEFWQNLLAGTCGLRALRSVDTSLLKCHNGAEVDAAALAPRLAERGIGTGDRGVDMGLLAAALALEQAGWARPPAEAAPQPMAVVFGSGAGAAHALFECFTTFATRGAHRMRPTSVPRCMANTLSSQITIRHALTGPNCVVASACTSSTTALGLALRLIRDGYAERVLAGGAESMFNPFFFGGWNHSGMLSPNPDPSRACRPFDAQRDGMLLGEGAGALVLEALDGALARGARIRGELAGFGESSDATSLTRPSAPRQAAAIGAALADAGIGPRDLGFVSAHGTGTRVNDVCEAQALHLALGPVASEVPVASTRSALGHLVGASGVVDAIAVLKALETGDFPPNRNLEQPDPECRLSLVGQRAVRLDARYVLKNSFGFGGSNAVLVLKRYDGKGTP